VPEPEPDPEPEPEPEPEPGDDDDDATAPPLPPELVPLDDDGALGFSLVPEPVPEDTFPPQATTVRQARRRRERMAGPHSNDRTERESQESRDKRRATLCRRDPSIRMPRAGGFMRPTWSHVTSTS
jgi:hypothetical protein